MKKIPTKSIFFIIVLGFILRIWGINFGLPFYLHQDEPIVVNHAFAYGAGDFNPHFFIIPPLCSYILFACYAILFIIGKLTCLFGGTEDFALLFISNPSVFYVIGRIILGVIPATISIYLVYFLYKKLFSDRGACFAAAIYSFSFLTVVNGHYAYLDNLMVLFVLLAFLFLIKMIEKPILKNYLFSAIFIGLAASTKYNAILLLVSFYVAHLMVIKEHKFSKINFILDRRLWIACLFIITTFALTNPFSILDWNLFFASITGKIRHTYIGWSHHIKYSLFEGVGPVLTVIGIAGLFVMFLKEKKAKIILFLSFPVLFYVHLVFCSQAFSRYVLPLIPFISIGAAYFIYVVLFRNNNKRSADVFVLFLSCILVISTLIKAIKADMLFSGPDTRSVSANWIMKNLPQGTKIAVDHTSFRPQIMQSEEQLIEKYKITNSQQGLEDLKNKKLELMIKSVKCGKPYNVYFLTAKVEERGQFLSTVPAISYSIKDLKDKKIEYVVLNYFSTNEDKKNFMRDIKEKADLIIAFSPYYDGKIRESYEDIDRTFMPIISKEIFNVKMTGPCIEIYKLRS